jgi:hypothetical protein
MNDIGALEASQAHPAASVEADHRLAEGILEGDELVQMSIKPSLWFIPCVSLNVLGLACVAAVLGGIMCTQPSWRWLGAVILQASILVGVLRVAFASLQWASRLYVLTNRRVMAFKGVLAIQRSQCQLRHVSHVNMTGLPYVRALRVGHLQMRSEVVDDGGVDWRFVARPEQVRDIVTEAVHRAQH